MAALPEVQKGVGYREVGWQIEERRFGKLGIHDGVAVRHGSSKGVPSRGYVVEDSVESLGTCPWFCLEGLHG
jgi:hypothetical protein